MLIVLFVVDSGELEGVEVAVKLIKKGHSDEAIKEVETMVTFSHPNILRLIGIVRSSGKNTIQCIFQLIDFLFLGSLFHSFV